jgi:hypothetical protein
LSESAAGVRHPLPGPLGPLRRGTIPIAAGLLLLGVTALCLAQGFAGIRADGHHTDRAVRVVAKVVSRDDESVRVRTDGARRLTLDSFYPEDYRVGGTVTVLEDGAWRRLSAEPYDAVGWQLAALAVGLPGLSLLATGLLARRRAATLRRTPVPVVRVLERMDGEGRIWIHAGDDAAGREPVLGGGFVVERSDADGHERGCEREHGTAHHADQVDEGEPFAAGTRLREAVMFGSAYEGGELVLVTTGRDTRPVVLRTAGPVRLPHPGEQPALATGGKSYTASADPDSEPQGPPAPDRVPTTLITTGRPLRWGPSALARAGGAALALAMVAGVASITRSLVTDGVDWHAALLLGLPAWGGSAAELLNWRVTADSSGLWLSGRWKVRHVPWESLRSVRYTKEGSVEIGMPDGSAWCLPGLGMPKAERRFGLHPSYVRMVEEVTALRAHPELRPTEPVSPRGRGFPLGPGLLALTVLVAGAWALH